MVGERLRRRRVLALAGAGVGAALAGCTATGDERPLDARESRDGSHQYLLFEDGDTRTFTVSVQFRGRDPDADRLRFKLTTGHRAGVELDRLRFELESPPGARSHESARIALVASGTAYEGLQFYQKPDDHTTAVVNLPDVDFGGSVGLEVDVEPRSDARTLAVAVDAGLSDEGRFPDEYVASARTVVDPAELV